MLEHIKSIATIVKDKFQKFQFDRKIEVPCQCQECWEEDNHYQCDKCLRVVPFCFGADDGFFELCDDCAYVERSMSVVNFSKEDILYAFAMEPIQGRETLTKYLQDYQQYAADLIDLSYELSRDLPENKSPLSEEDLALIYSAWSKQCEVRNAST